MSGRAGTTANRLQTKIRPVISRADEVKTEQQHTCYWALKFVQAPVVAMLIAGVVAAGISPNTSA
jgi:hypothetical protein